MKRREKDDSQITLPASEHLQVFNRSLSPSESLLAEKT
jgi:hypothetical protein